MGLTSIAWNPADSAFALGYLFGSVPFGVLFTWLFAGRDIRTVGSGNIGATNVLRTGSKPAAAATLLCDAAKGAVAVLVAREFITPGSDVFAALGAILGHIFPLWLGFRGGKGVATALGVILALDWRVGLLALATWLAVAAVTRISSLSALVAALLVPVFFFAFGLPHYGLVAGLSGLLIFLTHRDNISRLLRGEEPRIGRSAGHPSARPHGPSS